MDVPTRWNSTFLMLDSALPLKEAFGRLEQIDRNYKLNPSEDEWKVAYIVHDCLKKFYDATNHFSGNSFPTSNVFFPDICKLQLKLKEWENSGHDFIRNMAGPMKEKFEKYWDECCLVLAIAVVFDPRLKLALVEYNYNAIYGENAKKYVDRVRSAIVDLFVEYGGELNPSFGYACGSDVEETNFTGANKESDDISDDMFSNFDKWYYRSKSSTIRDYQKSELQMARDILAVPATTVASESAFSVGGRVIDESRAALLPDVVEALVTTSDWLETKKKEALSYQKGPLAKLLNPKILGDEIWWRVEAGQGLDQPMALRDPDLAETHTSIIVQCGQD
ncbi:hypothetical protein ACH5RR_023685 [Cinchona calisaya]|uniref:Transposase n=1 Tax=Cinchona calisaya TaxID=153742 RepID=A0ABD2ZGE5_9GENT